MSRTVIEVVKVGGSLVTRADFISALRQWLTERSRQKPDSHQVLVVGGGPLVDSLRQLDSVRPLPPELAHWQAIVLMESLGRIVGHWLPELTVTESFDTVRRRCASLGRTLFLATSFLREMEPHLPGVPLPVGWHVTSDSIAARVAVCLEAERLTLLKVVRAATIDDDWHYAARSGMVDEFFPTAIERIPHVEFDTLPATAGERAGMIFVPK